MSSAAKPIDELSAAIATEDLIDWNIETDIENRESGGADPGGRVGCVLDDDGVPDPTIRPRR